MGGGEASILAGCPKGCPCRWPWGYSGGQSAWAEEKLPYLQAARKAALVDGLVAIVGVRCGWVEGKLPYFQAARKAALVDGLVAVVLSTILQLAFRKLEEPAGVDGCGCWPPDWSLLRSFPEFFKPYSAVLCLCRYAFFANHVQVHETFVSGMCETAPPEIKDGKRR
eukprot:56715-Chlamydomonas_euryale.AAC.1